MIPDLYFTWPILYVIKPFFIEKLSKDTGYSFESPSSSDVNWLNGKYAKDCTSE
jgi:hypothetical protein